MQYTTVLARGWFSIALFALVGLVLSLIVSFVQPLKYSSTVRLLVLQDIGTNVDAFTASRSEERIADNLSTIIYTTTFFDQVLDSGFEIDESTFPVDDAKRRREWRKTVSATVSRGAGILTVSAFHQDVRQAEQLVRAVAAVLTTHVAEYTSGTHIEVRLIDAPLNSRWPVKPNLLGNGLSGLVLGGLFGTAYVLLQAERVRRRHQLVHEEF
jgi:uncharacterized protein involved in exopolysaccharide biosynthesis